MNKSAIIAATAILISGFPSLAQPQQQQQCDASYPDFCLPPNSPDLDCKDVPYRRFRVNQPDPHGFDRDKDGVGCES